MEASLIDGSRATAMGPLQPMLIPVVGSLH
jgi:hypothetical protein